MWSDYQAIPGKMTVSVEYNRYCSSLGSRPTPSVPNQFGSSQLGPGQLSRKPTQSQCIFLFYEKSSCLKLSFRSHRLHYGKPLLMADDHLEGIHIMNKSKKLKICCHIFNFDACMVTGPINDSQNKPHFQTKEITANLVLVFWKLHSKYLILFFNLVVLFTAKDVNCHSASQKQHCQMYNMIKLEMISHITITWYK